MALHIKVNDIQVSGGWEPYPSWIRMDMKPMFCDGGWSHSMTWTEAKALGEALLACATASKAAEDAVINRR